MKKEYVIGGLALLGVIGVVSYLRKPKRNSDGFFGANGKVRTTQSWCAKRNPDGSVSYITNNFSDTCPRGYRAVKDFGDRTDI